MDALPVEVEAPFRSGQRVRKSPDARQHGVYIMVPGEWPIEEVYLVANCWMLKLRGVERLQNARGFVPAPSEQPILCCGPSIREILADRYPRQSTAKRFT